MTATEPWLVYEIIFESCILHTTTLKQSDYKCLWNYKP